MVLNSLLCNNMYDAVLKLPMRADTMTIGFTEDDAVDDKVAEKSHADGQLSHCDNPTVGFDEGSTISRPQN